MIDIRNVGRELKPHIESKLSRGNSGAGVHVKVTVAYCPWSTGDCQYVKVCRAAINGLRS
jgi:hypothetical protein